MPTQLSSTATAPRISSSAPVLKRRRTGARGGPFELISTRITSWRVGGVPDWDLAAATEVACDSIVWATAACGTGGSAEAGRSAAGSGIADRRRSVPDRRTGGTSASRRRCLRSTSGNRTNEVYQAALSGASRYGRSRPQQRARHTGAYKRVVQRAGVQARQREHRRGHGRATTLRPAPFPG